MRRALVLGAMLLAAWLLSEAQIEVPSGPLSVAPAHPTVWRTRPRRRPT